MPAGIISKDAVPDLVAREAELRAILAERDEQLAHLADVLAAQQAAPVAVPVAPAAPLEPPVTPAPMSADDQEAVELGAVAILAREGRYPAPRAFWLSHIDRLGRLLAPEENAAGQRAAALRDPRGQDMLTVLQNTLA